MSIHFDEGEISKHEDSSQLHIINNEISLSAKPQGPCKKSVQKQKSKANKKDHKLLVQTGTLQQ
jgi:hypothetical protein